MSRPPSNRTEWARSLALIFALPAFFVLMGIGIRACQAQPCGCTPDPVGLHGAALRWR
jgi:hypothetical protein